MTSEKFDSMHGWIADDYDYKDECTDCQENFINCFCAKQNSRHVSDWSKVRELAINNVINYYASLTEKIGATEKFNAKTKDLGINSTSNPAGTEGKGDLTKKAVHSAIDPHFMAELAKVFQYGANKHGKNNFRMQTQEAAQEIRESISRHLNDGFLCGEEKDQETGLSHLAHTVANIMFLYRLCRKFGYNEVMRIVNGGD